MPTLQLVMSVLSESDDTADKAKYYKAYDRFAIAIFWAQIKFGDGLNAYFLLVGSQTIRFQMDYSKETMNPF